MTIYERTSGALIPQAGRTVSTFPSGLVKVEQRYIGKTSLASTHRASLTVGSPPPDGNEDPAIDGLKIFPDVQEVERGDGFTEYSVCLYGRTTETMRITGTVPFNRRSNSGLRYNTWQVFGSIAAPASFVMNYTALGLDPGLLDPFNFSTADPDEYMLSLTPGEQVFSESFQTPLGDTIQIPVSVARKKYTVEMTIDGTTVSSTYTFYLEDPEVIITSRRNFGDFFELDLYTKRTGDFETLSA